MSMKIVYNKDIQIDVPDMYVKKLISIGKNLKEQYRETIEIQSKHPLHLGLCNVLADRFHD